MADKKKSVKPESEIDYQAKKNLGDKLISTYKKSRKREKKLTEELMETIPRRAHKWHGFGYKETEESKRLNKEIRKEYELALATYQKAKALSSTYPFDMQIANVYNQMGDSENMIVSYLNLIKQNPNQKQSVKNNLQRFLNNDGIKSSKNYKILKKQLLKFVQEEKSGTDFSDMLIWFFMQNNQFELAFFQAKAIDKRMKENGFRVFEMANIFLDNSYYNLAIDAFDYLIKKGEENTYYIDAHINKLYAYNQMVEKGGDAKDLEELDKLYLEIIVELGRNRNTILLLSNYAHFKAFYQHNLQKAAEILDEAMLIPHLQKTDLAECKLEYADIMLLSNKVWTALLYYSQVEKDFKENPLGHEAKLRRAKIAYYQGDFDWAQAQLDVLKASTSKLISNDAMKLSLLITDNLGLDTSEIPMQIFARADLLFYQNNFVQCNLSLDSILNVFQGHSLTDEILFRKSKIYLKTNNIQKAVESLEKIIKEFSYDILADDAIFTLAEIFQEKIKNNEKAKDLYEKILTEHKGSIYSAEARKRFRKLRGDDVEKATL